MLASALPAHSLSLGNCVFGFQYSTCFSAHCLHIIICSFGHDSHAVVWYWSGVFFLTDLWMDFTKIHMQPMLGFRHNFILYPLTGLIMNLVCECFHNVPFHLGLSSIVFPKNGS